MQYILTFFAQRGYPMINTASNIAKTKSLKKGTLHSYHYHLFMQRMLYHCALYKACTEAKKKIGRPNRGKSTKL